MKVSGKVVAEAIAKKLQIQVKKLEIKPTLAIILAGPDPTSRIYVNNKIKAAKKIGIKTKLFEFPQNQFKDAVKAVQKLNADKNIHGIIIQHPTYEGWDFDSLVAKIDSQKDVDGFKDDSPYSGATALAVWEMLTAFAYLEGFSDTKSFLQDKKIVVLGKGKTAGGPIVKLLQGFGFDVLTIVKETKNPNPKTRRGDVVISATGKKHLVNRTNLKKGAYVVGVGVGKEVVGGKEKIYGDIDEAEVVKIAKLYCPTIGGIGPLTIVSLLKNVVESASKISITSTR